MKLFQDLFIQLEKEGIEYLVAGGFAVNLHQVQRATMDLDLILHLTKENILKFNKLMVAQGFQPRLPVNPDEFADPDIRQSWIKDRSLVVFTFINSKNPMENIDIFASEPKPFNELISRATKVTAFGASINIVGLEDLIEMKEKAGRDKDLFDIQQLKKKL